MPSFAYFESEAECPNCRFPTVVQARAGWGYVTHGHQPPAADGFYRPGDYIIWRMLSDGSVPAEANFGDGLSFNAGDSNESNVDLLDGVWGWAECPRCSQVSEAAWISIRDGRFIGIHRVGTCPSDRIDGDVVRVLDGRNKVSLPEFGTAPATLVAESELAVSAFWTAAP